MGMVHGPRGRFQEKYKRNRSIRILLSRLFQYLGKFKKIIGVALVLVLISTLFSTIDPLIIQSGVDLLLTPGGSLSGIILLFGVYLSLRIGSWIFNSANTWILTDAQTQFVQNLQEDVYTHLLRADLSYHRGEQSGDVTSRVTSDTEGLNTGVSVMISLSSQFLLLIVTFIMMWAISPQVAGVSLIAIPIALFFAGIFGTLGRKIMLSTRRVYGKVSGQIAENLAGIHVAKAFNREEETAETLKGLNAQVYKYGYKFMSLMTLMHPLIQTFGIVFIALILFVSAALFTGGISAITIGEVLLGTILIRRFLRPMVFLTMQLTALQNSLASMDRLFDVLDTKPTVIESPEATDLLLESDGITFSDVTFAYQEGKPVLHSHWSW
ncbi:MAG: ABC transporter transmembrane domain-containing protein [Candidatus Ranarchaeia archaeon]|jgi:ATP-binding cassette subfamily B protein